MTDALRVEDLKKTFRRPGATPVDALQGLSFSVPEGHIFGLLGPNAAGKTTTLRILTTLIGATSGRAEVAGVDVSRDPLGVRKRIVVVVQESAAEIFLTVRDNLLTFGRFHGLHGPDLKRRADAVMELLRQQARQGRTIVLTTQILQEAESLCDDILIINRGRQIARGDVPAIKALSTTRNASLEDVFVELTTSDRA